MNLNSPDETVYLSAINETTYSGSISLEKGANYHIMLKIETEDEVIEIYHDIFSTGSKNIAGFPMELTTFGILIAMVYIIRKQKRNI